MNYQIITDEERLKAFIDWLPDLEKAETFYCCLFARKKYSESVKIKSDKSQLKRFTSPKNRLLEKIRQLECPLGAYTQNGVVIPQEALVLYINPNPRCFIRATRSGLKKLCDRVTGPYDGYNPHQDILSEIQHSCSRKVYLDFDFDNVDAHTVLGAMIKQNFINLDSTRWLKTRGGFHVIVTVDKINPQYSKVWYNGLMSLPGVDIRVDNMIPVPGCVQGVFSPYFLDIGKQEIYSTTSIFSDEAPSFRELKEEDLPNC